MRILHISTRLILGGSQENTVLSCEGQARMGHDVHLAFGPIYGPEGSLLERVERFRTPDGRGITTHVVPHLVREVSPRADWRGRAELESLVRELKPDVVHTHSSKAGIIGRSAAWSSRVHHVAGSSWAQVNERAGRPVVDLNVAAREEAEDGFALSLCDIWIPTAVIHTIHGPPFMPIEGSPLRRLKVRLNNAMYTAAERYAARRCHTIVSVADAMTRQFLARRIGRPEQYTTVYSGMETERYLRPAPGQSRAEIRAKLGLADTDLVIGTVARLAQHKGHDDLLDALGEDLKSHPNWKLLWVGDGWWRDRLLARVRGLGLTNQVITTGLVPSEEVPGHVRAMDILAHPSYREGLPRTVPQALLCGVAPVAYDVDGTGEVCREMETGRLVRPGDRAGLRAAIVWLAEHPAEREAMAARGREWCRERFSAERMVADLERVYAAAIQAARRG